MGRFGGNDFPLLYPKRSHISQQKKKIAEFWPLLFAQTQVTYLTFIFLTLQTLAKLKTTFGRNLLYWML
jgi:hypothetical protein